MHARFHADNGGFEISELTSQNGPTKLRWSAQGERVWTRIARLRLRGKRSTCGWDRIGRGFCLLRCSTNGGKFQPAGEVNIQNAKAIYDGQRWQLTATVVSLDSSFSYYRFPYRLEHGTGQLNLAYDPQVGQNRLEVHLTAYAGSRPIQIDGQFLNPGPEYTGGISLRGTEIPFDQSLYFAISKTQPKASEVVQTLQLQGSFDFAVNNVKEDPAAHGDESARDDRTESMLPATTTSFGIRYTT